MSKVKYTKEHEWISVEGNVGTVGITAYAMEQLGDLVFVEIPDAGKTVEQGDEAAVVESVKAASEIYSPVDGEIIEGNSAVGDDAAAVSGDPDEDGWIFKIKMSDPSQLEDMMDLEEYQAYVDELD